MNLKKLKKVLCVALSAFIVVGEAGNVTTLAAESETIQENAGEETEEGTTTEDVAEPEMEEDTEAVTEGETEEVDEQEAQEDMEEDVGTEEVETVGTVGTVNTVGTIPLNGATTYQSTARYQELYFKISVTQKGYLNVSGKGLNQDEDIDFGSFTVYNASLENITDEYELSDSNVTSNKIGVEPGTYYVKWLTDYDISAEVQLSAAFSASNVWESESNDTFLTADAIDINTTYYGTVYWGESDNFDEGDYFKFTTTKAGYVSLDFMQTKREEAKTEYYKVTLYNAEYEKLTTFSVKGSDTEKSSVKIGVESGTYYVLVEGAYSRYKEGLEYGIKVNWTQSDYWEKEINSSMTKATGMVLNKTYSGTINDSGDDDYYKFTLSRAGVVTLNMGHALLAKVSNSYYQVSLYDADGKSVYMQMVSNGSDTSLTGSKIGLDKGTYYIKITSDVCDYRDTGVYTIQADFSASDVWETEFNNTTGTADKISVNKAYSGVLSSDEDEDYYKVQTEADGYITLNFKHAKLETTDSYFEICVIRSNGTQITQFLSGGYDTSITTSKIGLEKGTYYIKVSEYIKYSDTPYKLQVNFKEASNWEKENNSTVKRATTISIGKDYCGTSYGERVNCADIDYYKFTIDKKTWVNISFKHASTGEASTAWSVSLRTKDNGTVYSASNKKAVSIGNVVGTKTYASTGNVLLNEGTYYIKISGDSNKTEYTVNVSNVKIKAPVITSVNSVSYNSIKVKWKEVCGADQYYIYRSSSKNGAYEKVKTLKAGSNSFIDKNLVTGKNYYYKIKCSGTTNKKVTSGYSEVKGAKPVPATPKVTLASSQKNQMAVSWKQISGADGYEVYRADSRDGKFSKITTVSIGKTVTYTDKKVNSGKIYYYKVRAYKTVNEKKVYGSYSSVVSQKTK